MKPKLHRVYLFAFISSFSWFIPLQAQDEVIYSPNIYAKVDSVYPSKEVIGIANFDNFDVETGDIIMIYQVKGATHSPYESFSNSKPADEYVTYSNETGKYEFFIIADIDFTNRLITTTRPLLSDYDNGESIQLIKTSFYFGDAVVNDDIEVESWDPVKGFGGVFPIIVYQKLTLNADIIADGDGFRGGALDADDLIRSCNNDEEEFYQDTEIDKAANKGEGHVTQRLTWTRGPGYIGNGGGGGVGKFSGGAGGGNWGKGGQSGNQVSECFSTGFENNGGVVNKGIGTDFYNLDNTDALNRILFGGGGGAGIGENELSGKPWATGGANGGGIIIILCDSLEANSGKLSARGESAVGVAEAGGGGGGAGGAILIDARSVTGNLNVDVTGGNGGEVNNPSVCPGPGGGGGGGLLWYSWNSMPSNIQLNAIGGTEGDQPTECISNTAWPGDDGSELGKLRAPLNGFYFNKIRGYDEICGGQRPDTIRGTVPKGGNGDFDFKWEYSQDSLNWSVYPAKISDSVDFQPDVLYDTTYFRRLVTYNAITDTSLSVRIDVWPIIEDNLAQTNNQTICELDFGEKIMANQPRGGDDNFSFHWEKSTNLTDWEIIESDTTLTSIIPGQLDTTTYYRRYIESVVVCQDYSDTVTIAVQPGLTNFGILEDIQSCQGFDADTLEGEPGLSGGDMTNYYYFWQIKGETGDWGNLDNDTTISYLMPGTLNDTSFFRRITRSGECIDTSGQVKIEVLVPISNNIIFGDDKICYGEEGLEITNNGIVDGGNFVDYNYYWEIGLNTSSWQIDSGEIETNYLPGRLYDTTLIRRIVNSSACWDTSDYVTIQVVPEIINQLSSPDTTICQAFYPNMFDEDPASGGNGSFSYQWEQKQDNDWQNVDGNGINYLYQSPELFDTTLFRRIVYSDICNRESDTITITVLPSISNNLIDESPIAYTCFEIPKLLASTNPIGGDNSYLYQWEKSVDNVVWATTENNLDTDFLTPELQDSIYYRRIVFSGDYKQCKDTSENVLLRIHSLPVGVLADQDTAVCDEELVPFNYSFTGASPWNIYFSDHSSYTVTNANSIILKGFMGSDVSSQNQIEIDSLRDGNNCKATELSGLVSVISYEVPSPKITSASDVCGNLATVTAETPKFLAYWRGEKLSFVDSANHISEVQSSVYDTSMMIIWHEKNNFCSNEDTASMVFFQQPQLETNFDTLLLYNEFEKELTAPEPEYDSVTWILLDEFGEEKDYFGNNSTHAAINLTIDEFTNYQVVYSINNGACLATDTLIVDIRDIYRPNIFIPDEHTYFYIDGIESEGKKKLTIINPWGNVVYQSNNYGVNGDLWDGTNKGDPLPEGTYYYILETDRKKPFKDFIILRRNVSNVN